MRIVNSSNSKHSSHLRTDLTSVSQNDFFLVILQQDRHHCKRARHDSSRRTVGRFIGQLQSRAALAALYTPSRLSHNVRRTRSWSCLRTRRGGDTIFAFFISVDAFFRATAHVAFFTPSFSVDASSAVSPRAVLIFPRVLRRRGNSRSAPPPPVRSKTCSAYRGLTGARRCRGCR